MSSPAVVRYEPFEVDVRLANLGGLSVAILHEAIRAGAVARMACTENMPLCFPGTAAWAYTITALRDLLMSEGWGKSDAGNFATVVSPDQSFAIAASTATEGAGDRWRNVKTKFPKGPVMIEKVVANGEVDLFGNPTMIKRLEPAGTTWLLLMAPSAVGVRCELSRPDGIGDDRRIDSWAERILLPTVDLADSGGKLPLPELGPDFDVDVRRVG